MSNWLDKIMPSKIRSESRQRTGVPEGLWKKCPKCGAFLYKPELEKNLDVCPKCNHHLRVSARRRLDIFLDNLKVHYSFSCMVDHSYIFLRQDEDQAIKNL